MRVFKNKPFASDNIRDDELAAFKMLAAEMLAYDDAALTAAMTAGALVEVFSDEETIS